MFDFKKDSDEEEVKVEKPAYVPPVQRAPSVSLQDLFDSAGIKYFTAKEFQTLGGSNSVEGSSGYGLNTLPPSELYPNILAVAKIWDEIRRRIGQPLYVNSCYRNEAYNKAVGGVRNSQHLDANAADVSGVSPKLMQRTARALRKEGWFKGGIGLYSSFCHVDVRGSNHDWG